jgi:hypothetical protein
MVRSGIPLGRRTEQSKLSAEYFQMIEAVEYTRKQDDGAMPENWCAAHAHSHGLHPLLKITMHAMQFYKDSL